MVAARSPRKDPPTTQPETPLASILFAWELGTGFGHLMPYLDLAKALLERGHKVSFATRDLATAGSVFGQLDVTLIQSPALYGKVDKPSLPGHSYLDVLHNAGFSDTDALHSRLRAWRFVFEATRPDIAVFDAAPCAALAARGFPCRRITSGTGFFIPPPTAPVPPLRYWQPRPPHSLADQEERMLAALHTACQAADLPRIEAVHQLVEADATFLMNFPELDHYRDRRHAQYIGTFPPREFGQRYDWPDGNGPKVFAYLYPFKTLPSLLESMQRMALRAIIYAPQVAPKTRQRHASSTLHFVDRPASIRHALAGCDFAITGGSLSSSASVLLAGKPLLTLPTTLERQIVGLRIRDLGAGLAAPQLKPGGMAAKLEALAKAERFGEAARQFAARYADRDKDWQLARMLSHIEALLPVTEALAPVRR